jgi:hypothetical protein
MDTAAAGTAALADEQITGSALDNVLQADLAILSIMATRDAPGMCAAEYGQSVQYAAFPMWCSSEV